MPANQMYESVVVPDDNAVFASPMTSLTHQMSSAGLTPAAAAAAAAAAGSNKPALISDSVKFSIDDSNDSLLQFASGTATPAAAAAAGSQQRRRPTLLQQQLSCEDDDDEVDWVLRRPARLRYDDDDDDEDSAPADRRNGTPIRSRAAPAPPTFCSSPSEPTLRRCLWSPSASNANSRSGADQQQQLRLASVPLIGFSSSPTSMQAPPPPPPRPPPTSMSSAAVQHPQPRRRSFKRPSPTGQQEQQQQQLEQTPKMATPKRRRMGRTPMADSTNSRAPSAAEEQQPKKPPLLQRCTSEMSTLVGKCGSAPVLDSVKVDNAIASIDSLNLIGNSEQQHSLPTVTALDFGIRYVTAATVSGLLHGDFADQVPNYKIIDCRYPYEFNGGHIQGAINIYKQEDLLSTIMQPAMAAAAESDSLAQSRPVLIFHCEFSSERAPKLARFLRQMDRESNAENYPLLHFPEVYLLKDGYKGFFNGHKADCQPEHYRRMADPAFRDELAAFQRDRLDWQRRSSHTRHSRLQRLASCQQFH